MIHWTSIATCVPKDKADEMERRLTAEGIEILTAESNSWIGKLRSFVEQQPDMTVFVDRDEVDRANAIISGVFDPTAPQESIESYVQRMSDEKLKELLAATGWPDLVLDPAKQTQRLRRLPPEPIPLNDRTLPWKLLAMCAIIGPVGRFIAGEMLSRTHFWDGQIIPFYEATTHERCGRFAKHGGRLFYALIIALCVMKCVR